MNHENHEGSRKHEGHEVLSKSFRMRQPSPLEPEADRFMIHTIGCAIVVHRALGPAFLESIYRKAMCVELDARGLAYEVERPVRVAYRGVEIPGQRVDLIVGGLIIVELKAVVRLDRVHVGQVISYLKLRVLRVRRVATFVVKGL
jgi:GxxExxY protein